MSCVVWNAPKVPASVARPSKGRKRMQQACRDYWQRVYGAHAERTSRGGVTWLR